MPLRIAGLPVLSPSELAAGARSLLGWTDEAVAVVADLPVRVAALVDEAERLVARVGTTLDRVDAAVERVEGVSDSVEQLVGQIVPITGSAEAVLESVGATGAGAHALLEIFRPLAERGSPLLKHFLDEFTERELHALLRLIDHVPQFTDHMEADIMPILATLDRVGPDVHELLDVLKDVRQALQGVPGFRLLRRRGADVDDGPTA